MDSLPLTVNGKLDRKALPEPSFTDGSTYSAPENELQAHMCRIYAEVLGLDGEKVGIDDDFFRLGGDSISSIQVVNRMRQQLGISISVRDVFSYKNIRSLYTHKIEGLQESNRCGLLSESGLLEGEVGLLPIQAWFFERVSKGMLPAFDHWNQSFCINVPELDTEILRRSVELLAGYHDALRMRYEMPSGEVARQHYGGSAENCVVDCCDISGWEEERVSAIMTGWQSHFSIVDGPLFHVGYLYGGANGQCLLHFSAHHLVIDGVSWRILKDDLKTLYSYLCEHPLDSVVSAESILGGKMTSYRQWSDYVASYADSNSSEQDYWESLSSVSQATNGALSALAVSDDSHCGLSLDEERTSRLLRKANKAFSTGINDLLLSALSEAMCELDGRTEHCITLEGHGRDHLREDIDISRTVGWFTTMYPVMLHSHEGDYRKTIPYTKDSLRAVPGNGLGFGAVLGYSSGTLPLVVFNYLGQFDGKSADNRSLWEFHNGMTGNSSDERNRDENLLSINGGVIDGRLNFSVTGKFSPELLRRFTRRLQEHLESIVDYLCALDRSFLTVSDVGCVISQNHLDYIQESREVDGVYLANSLQEGFIYHALSQDGTDDAYIVQLMWEYLCEVNPDLLRQSWERCMDKFPSMRLRFSWRDELVQIIDKRSSLDWRYSDISGYGGPEQARILEELCASDRKEMYDLSSGPLFRVYLVRTGKANHTCLFSCHHSITDGWSNPILISCLHAFYRSMSKGNPGELLADTAYGEAQRFLQEHRSDDLSFWKQYTALLEDQEDLSGLLRPEKRGVRLSEYRHIQEPCTDELTLSSEKTALLRSYCSSNGFTLNALFQYCWHRQLHIYGGCDTTSVGMTVSGRNLPVDNIEQSVGLFINTLPVIYAHRPDCQVADAVRELQDLINEVNSRSNVSLAGIQKDGRTLFSTLFVFENYPVPENGADEEDGLQLAFRGGKEKVDYPIGIVAFETGGRSVIRINYAGELISAETARALLSGIKDILTQILEEPGVLVSDLHVTGASERRKLLYDWNLTRRAYPCGRTVHSLFEEQVGRTPDNLAVVYEDVRLTYAELNERANRLAHHLLGTYGLRPDDRVVLCLDRSERMIVSILAVLKCGSAYVPVSPQYPEERISYVLSDTGARAVICDSAYVQLFERLCGSGTGVVPAGSPEFERELLSACPVTNPVTETGPRNLAYVIYTSGTTGKPKGVMVEHKSVVNRIEWMNVQYPLAENDKILQKTPYTFDVSVWELFWANWYGACIVFAQSEGHKDSIYIAQLIQNEKITIVHFVPSMFDAFMDSIKSEGIVSTCDTLRYIFCSGEALNIHTVRKGRLLFDAKIHNLYGPTETTVDVLYYDCNSKDIDCILIGRPIANTTAYILDSCLRPLPVGAIGELYIGGDGVARGYLNNDELTAERFIANPFQSEEDKLAGFNDRLYKTGDLVCYLPDGNIEYIGRNDFQVKIRGFRIKFEEIESRLSSYPGISRSVALALEHGSGTKFLVGYYVCESEIQPSELDAFLAQELPDYMIPSAYVRMDSLPLTVNGKLDRKALPEPSFTDGSTYSAPENELQAHMCRIYAEVLGLDGEKVGIDDDFFRLGGNSVLTIKLVNMINKSEKMQIKIFDVYKNKSVRKLCKDYN